MPACVHQPRTLQPWATARALRISTLSSTIWVCFLAAASPLLIPFVFGFSYEKSVVPLLLLAPGIIAFAIVRLTGQCLIRLGRPLTMSAITVGALAVNITLDTLFIPQWGAAGAALLSTIAQSLLAAIEITRFIRHANSKRSEEDAVQME
uniref:lipopolysaccharide biosynthesis protein n=1 Tax=Nonomuraea sp. G32 TaxID=3067274 RepID=UPI0035301F32